jgi:hypothetical protein
MDTDLFLRRLFQDFQYLQSGTGQARNLRRQDHISSRCLLKQHLAYPAFLPPDLAACGVLPEFERHELVVVRVPQKPVALVIDILLVGGDPEIGVDRHFYRVNSITEFINMHIG